MNKRVSGHENKAAVWGYHSVRGIESLLDVLNGRYSCIICC